MTSRTGNPVRFTSGPIAIHLDDEWRAVSCSCQSGRTCIAV
jgi:hypothetical protein